MFFLTKKKIPFSEIIPGDYVDFHSHLMPGIDDGAKTKYKAAFIIEEMEKIGVKKVITTPHIIQDVWPNTTAIIQDKESEMRKVLSTIGIEIKLEVAAEYMLDDLFHERLMKKDILSITGNYVLVEMSTFNPPINLQEQLFDIKVADYTPILAHPERYSFYFDDYKKFEELKDSGFIFQLNLLSAKGFYGESVQKMALKLLNDGLYDFAGSDIHNLHQFEVLSRGFTKKIAKKIEVLVRNNSLLF